MSTPVLQWSDLARNPKQIAEIVERDGEARIERRGDEQLILMEARRYDDTRNHLETATRLLRNVVLSEAVDDAVEQTFPWTAVMSPAARVSFFGEFVETFAACMDLDVWIPMEQTLHEWKATAAIYADPELLAVLRRPKVVEELDPVPPPEVPDDEAG